MAESSQTESPKAGMQYGGFWIRFVAQIIDGIIIGIPMSIFYAIFVGSMVTNSVQVNVTTGEVGVNTGSIFASMGLLWIVALVIGFGYPIFMLGKFGATLGKMALGLKVVDENYQPISYGKAALREIVGKWISAIVLYLGFIWIGIDEKKQGWHDKIAKTYVIKTR